VKSHPPEAGSPSGEQHRGLDVRATPACGGDPAIEIDADVATDVATEYRWNNILLVDTPGVGVGRDLHDERVRVRSEVRILSCSC